MVWSYAVFLFRIRMADILQLSKHFHKVRSHLQEYWLSASHWGRFCRSKPSQTTSNKLAESDCPLEVHDRSLLEACGMQDACRGFKIGEKSRLEATGRFSILQGSCASLAAWVECLTWAVFLHLPKMPNSAKTLCGKC
jgi:hypothetical protein